jgi:hypothetical protein
MSVVAAFRTGTDLSKVIALVVFLASALQAEIADLPKMFLIRGIEFSHEATQTGHFILTDALQR